MLLALLCQVKFEVGGTMCHHVTPCAKIRSSAKTFRQVEENINIIISTSQWLSHQRLQQFLSCTVPVAIQSTKYSTAADFGKGIPD
jgi:hypothetical protein